METTNKQKSNAIYVVILIVSIMIIVGILAFSIHQKKKTEQKVLNAINRGESLEETLQESLDDYQKTTNELNGEVKQKTEELKKEGK